MNFGSWITVAFVLFAGLIISLVVVCVRQDVSLVSADYYQQEIKYQSRIDDISNAQESSTKVELTRTPGENRLELSFGEQVEALTGEVVMFRPSDAKLDKKFLLKLDDTGSFQMDTSQLKKGLWKMKISWQQGGQTFFEEKTIVI
ncbi:MAG: FixH family protein [Imperialibacter sp.]|uniref:FixH family protein n=1 Tax=Imperialibacter sp. TaxID=2038411 RepID=UPI0032ED6510